MKVFVSWSKEFSKEVAIALRDWLPKTLQSVEPYVSSEDIEKGSRWHMDISKRLDETAFGIICLTKENANSPWINFEAGALGKCVDNSKVCPLLIDMQPSDVQGPISSFQTTNIGDKDDFFKLISSINESSEQPVKEDVLVDVFEVWWPKLNEKLTEITKKHEAKKGRKSTTKPTEIANEEKESQILEELLSISRSNFQLLRDPKSLVPEEYLDTVFNRKQSRDNFHSPTRIPRELVVDLKRSIKSLKRLKTDFMKSANFYPQGESGYQVGLESFNSADLTPQGEFERAVNGLDEVARYLDMVVL